MKTCALGLSGLLMLAATIPIPKRPVLIWNASQSVPIGLYLIVPRSLHVGNFVVVRLSETMQALAEQRQYIGPDTPLLKRVAAMNGDTVCRHKSIVVINHRHIVIAFTSDHRARPLPAWRGCRRLTGGQVFVLGTHPESFDSRYFGPLAGEQVVGPAVSLLTLSSP
ncbi:MAG: S26 family signal peptidase [Proteobacteria bacterium]|nr:S26 family signal peptidase [Pseudomonadota bacterium]